MNFMKTCSRRIWILFILLLFSHIGNAQTLILKGTIKDAHSDERIPFASMRMQGTGRGRLSDSAGSFIFRFEHWPSATLLFSYVGYQDSKLPLSPSLLAAADRTDTVNRSIIMERGQYAL